jgi:hypothetical protein
MSEEITKETEPSSNGFVTQDPEKNKVTRKSTQEFRKSYYDIQVNTKNPHLKLPAEVLLRIFGFLDFPDLCALSCASQTFRTLARYALHLALSFVLIYFTKLFKQRIKS